MKMGGDFLGDFFSDTVFVRRVMKVYDMVCFGVPLYVFGQSRLGLNAEGSVGVKQDGSRVERLTFIVPKERFGSKGMQGWDDFIVGEGYGTIEDVGKDGCWRKGIEADKVSGIVNIGAKIN